MKNKDMVFVTCSAKKYEDSLLRQSFHDMHYIEYNVYPYSNNTVSIASCYNHAIDSMEDRDAETKVVLCHDDVYINCRDLRERVIDGLKTYDVIGIAGSEQANIKEPALWHLMSDRKFHHGAVAHATNNKSPFPYFVSSFGTIPSRVLLIDGVFIATTLKVLRDVRFDESNPARFHYYDLAFSLDCNSKKYKIGVVEVPIVHMSPGLRNIDDEFRAGQDWFIKKWG